MYIQQGKFPYSFDFKFLRVDSEEKIRVEVAKEVRLKVLPGYISAVYIGYFKTRLLHIRALRAAGGA